MADQIQHFEFAVAEERGTIAAKENCRLVSAAKETNIVGSTAEETIAEETTVEETTGVRSEWASQLAF